MLNGIFIIFPSYFRDALHNYCWFRSGIRSRKVKPIEKQLIKRPLLIRWDFKVSTGVELDGEKKI